MKSAYWAYWLVVLGVFVTVVLLLIQNFTKTNTQNYYMMKEITEAALVDSVDLAYYRQYGEVKINKEKFYEVFIRRFAEAASTDTTYDIEFYEIYEAPPKVGVKISSQTESFNITGGNETLELVERIDGILQTDNFSYQG